MSLGGEQWPCPDQEVETNWPEDLTLPQALPSQGHFSPSWTAGLVWTGLWSQRAWAVPLQPGAQSSSGSLASYSDPHCLIQSQPELREEGLGPGSRG